MTSIKTFGLILQSTISKFESERDDAISKINRAIESPNTLENVEFIVAENFERLSLANLKISTVLDEFKKMIDDEQRIGLKK